MMTCSYRLIQGISVGVAGEDQEAGARFSKIERALSLIGEVAPRRLQRIRADLGQILVGPGRSALLWVPTRTCVIPQSRVDRASVSAVALSVVHEAAHARLARAGVRPYPRRKFRMEVLCVGEELGFASLLPETRFPSRDVVIDELRELQRDLRARSPERRAPHN